MSQDQQLSFDADSIRAAGKLQKNERLLSAVVPEMVIKYHPNFSPLTATGRLFRK